MTPGSSADASALRRTTSISGMVSACVLIAGEEAVAEPIRRTTTSNGRRRR
jgi:hypothetical protein